MKNLLRLLIALTTALSAHSQSFTADPGSVSIPRYANQTAITTAIPAPTTGMLVFNSFTGQFTFWSGAAWVSIANGVSWLLNNTTNRTQLTGMAGNSDIEINRIISQANSTLAAPLISTFSPGNIFLRYGRSSSTAAVFQESTTGLVPGNSSINWRYADNSNPQVITDMFGYSGTTFSITGALNATGNAAIGGSISATGTSGLTGRVTIGASTATTAGVEIRSQTSTDANPDIYFKGTNNVLRFGNNVDGTSIVQTTTSANVPNTATLAWKHITNAATPVATPMMTLQGDGDLAVNGFTQLGGSTADVPAIKTKIISGTMPNAATTTVTVAHGLTASKIIEARVMITGLSNIIVSDNYTPTASVGGTVYGYLFNTNVDGTNVNIVKNTSTTSSSNAITTAGGITATYRIFITYTP